MSRFKKALYVIVPALLLAVVIIKLKSNKDIAEQKIYQLDKSKPLIVKGQVVQYERLDYVQFFSGTFLPNREARISADGQGKITAMFVDEGDQVVKGQPLIQLDESMIKLQIENVEVQIESYAADVKRYEILSESDAVQGIKLEKAKVALKAAQVQRATLQEQLDKTTVRAPFPGIITMKMTEVGTFAAPGVPLLLLSDISRLKFLIRVSEYDLSKFKTGEFFDVSADVFPDKNWKAHATMISDRANEGGSYRVQFEVDNDAKPVIKSGMFGKLHFVAASAHEGVLVSASSVQDRIGQKSIYLVKNSQATVQVVEVGEKTKDKIMIKSGLQPGDTIVTEGFINLFDGANVQVKLN